MRKSHKEHLTSKEWKLVEEHRKKKEQNEWLSWKPRPLGDYSAEDKIAAFDRLYGFALNSHETTVRDKFENEDTKSYAFEAVMLLLGKDVFKAQSKILYGR